MDGLPQRVGGSALTCAVFVHPVWRRSSLARLLRDSAERLSPTMPTLVDMCRNIRQLHNFEPPATSDEVRGAALQYVRKVSGSTRPSQANQAAFDEAVEAVAHATQHLLDHLTTSTPPKNREIEAAKARARAQTRYASA